MKIVYAMLGRRKLFVVGGAYSLNTIAIFECNALSEDSS